MDAREATDPLLEALSNPTSGQAIGAAAALGTFREPRAVAPLIELLGDEATRWHAAQALGEIGGPEAESVLLAAMARQDYAIMAGAHAFYLRHNGPGMDAALLDLLQQSNDLAVAQTLILEGSPALAKSARAWAEGRGFKLVKTEGGHTWEQVPAPQ
jgi:HEAT repeat protein